MGSNPVGNAIALPILTKQTKKKPSLGKEGFFERRRLSMCGEYNLLTL